MLESCREEGSWEILAWVFRNVFIQPTKMAFFHKVVGSVFSAPKYSACKNMVALYTASPLFGYFPRIFQMEAAKKRIGNEL